MAISSQTAAPETSPPTDAGRSLAIFERVPATAGRPASRSRRVGRGGHVDTQSRATVPARRKVITGPKVDDSRSRVVR